MAMDEMTDEESMFLDNCIRTKTWPNVDLIILIIPKLVQKVAALEADLVDKDRRIKVHDEKAQDYITSLERTITSLKAENKDLNLEIESLKGNLIISIDEKQKKIYMTKKTDPDYREEYNVQEKEPGQERPDERAVGTASVHQVGPTPTSSGPETPAPQTTHKQTFGGVGWYHKGKVEDCHTCFPKKEPPASDKPNIVFNGEKYTEPETPAPEIYHDCIAPGAYAEYGCGACGFATHCSKKAPKKKEDE